MTTPVDHWWNHVSFALHFDGANAGTTFTEEKGHTVTVGGAVTTSTTAPKFGTACGNFPGANTDKLTLATADLPVANTNFGSGNFTIEGWFKENAVSRQYMTMLEKDNGAFAAGSWSLLINRATAGDGVVAFYLADYSAATYLLTSTSTYGDNTWHHVAVVRNANQWLLFLDGLLEDAKVSTATITDLAAATIIGNSVNASRGWTGTLDEWRVTKGFARYTVPFSAPAAAFPNTFNDGTYTGPTGPAGASLQGDPGPPGEDGQGIAGLAVALPPPPPQYDVRDQRETRRLIEQALRG